MGLPANVLAPPLQPGAQSPWRRALLGGLKFWVIANLFYLVISLMSQVFFRGTSNPGHREGWLSWDAEIYIGLAQRGYVPGDNGFPAFFPLYPIMVRAASYLTGGNFEVAALVVSNLALLGLLVVLYRLVEFEYDGQLSERVLLALLAFPTAFFLIAGYNESLFLLLAVTALYCIRTQNWWLAGVFGALATATRLAGVMLVLSFVYEYLRVRDFRLSRIRPDAWAVALIPAGLVAFMGYCWVHLGNPLAFLEAQAKWGRKGYAFPWEGIYWSFYHSIDPNMDPVGRLYGFLQGLLALAAVISLVLSVVGPWKLGRARGYLILFGAGGLLLPLVSPYPGMPLAALPRYVLEIVPMFIIFGRLAENEWFQRFYLFVALGFQVCLALMFRRYEWVS